MKTTLRISKMPKLDAIVFIHLKRRHDRLLHLQKEFKTVQDLMPSNVEILTAIDFKTDLSEEEEEIAIEYGNRKNTATKSRAEWACSVSHARAYELMLKKGWKTMAVFEDDVQFATQKGETRRDVMKRLNWVMQHLLPADFDLLYVKTKREVEIAHFDEKEIKVIPVQNSWGAWAYVVSRRMSKELLAQRDRWMSRKSTKKFYTADGLLVSCCGKPQKYKCFETTRTLMGYKNGFSDIEQKHRRAKRMVLSPSVSRSIIRRSAAAAASTSSGDEKHEKPKNKKEQSRRRSSSTSRSSRMRHHTQYTSSSRDHHTSSSSIQDD
jgi:GR25 family glycosyltransferase involved in LPS biosynthesis